MFAKLWNDEAGIVALEYLLLSVIVGLGLVVGFSSVAGALNAEYAELAQAILSINDSYSYKGYSSCTGTSGATTVSDVDGTLLFTTTTDTAPTTVSATICP